MNDQFHKVIGIDLGTTYSAVAAYNTYTEQAEIISNKIDTSAGSGETTPSVISLNQMNKAIVGQAAKNNLAVRPQDTVIEIKREMGENFRPETLQKYNAGKYSEKDPVRVFFAGEWMLPQAISAFTLMKMKEIAEIELGEEIRDAVITVPAYFTEKQKKATKEAALLAGLYPRQLIPEPTAAAICYGVDKMESEKKTFLVFDLGGGTFDVSIIVVEGENIDVIATSGDPRLGGGDFDDAIVYWAIDQLKQKGVDVSQDPSALARIKERAESTKIALSSFSSAKLDLMFLNNPNIQNLELTREEFEDIIDPVDPNKKSLLRKSLSYVDIAIKNAEEKKGVTRDHIDAILLVGGSSKIPKVRNMLLDYFQKDESFVRSDVNPDAVVARGAAIMGYRFKPSPPPFDIKRELDSSLVNRDVEDDMHISLITEHSLGVGVQENLVSRIVEQGSNIPIEVKRGGYVNSGPATDIPVEVYQGEGKYTYENTLIGTLHIGPMEPRPAGEHKFEVIFKLDINGLLTMIILHLNENREYVAQFEQKTGVGGDDALIILRKKLLSLYAASSAQTPGFPDSTAAAEPAVVPPPVPQPGTQQPAAAPAPPPPQAEPAPVSPPQTAAQPIQPSVPPQPDSGSPLPQQVPPAPAAAQAPPQPVPSDQPVSAQAPPSQIELIEPASEVPDQFKQLVRRVKKQLIKQYDENLANAYNVFVSEINKGTAENDLLDAGDDLAEAFDDARK